MILPLWMIFFDENFFFLRWRLKFQLCSWIFCGCLTQKVNLEKIFLVAICWLIDSLTVFVLFVICFYFYSFWKGALHKFLAIGFVSSFFLTRVASYPFNVKSWIEKDPEMKALWKAPLFKGIVVGMWLLQTFWFTQITANAYQTLMGKRKKWKIFINDAEFANIEGMRRFIRMISKHGSMEACLCAYLCWNQSWGCTGCFL